MPTAAMISTTGKLRLCSVPGLLLAIILLLNPRAWAADDQAPMNVIMILSDDLGWADVSYNGRSDFYETPHFDALAARSVSFHRAYAASPLCSPTRASIMLGQNPARIGLTEPLAHSQSHTQVSSGASAPPHEKSIGTTSAAVFPNNLPTLARLIHGAGYTTGHFGKWHLGRAPHSPLENGFDVDIPRHPGPDPAGSFIAPWGFEHLEPNRPDEHIEDRMAEEAVAWMEQQVAADRPFYLQYWQFSVHDPFDAKPDLVEKYRRKAKGDHTKSPTYAAMVESMDDSIGTLVAAVERLGIADRTAIIFASDNGGNRYNGIIETDINGVEYTVNPTDNAPLRGGKATMWEGGIRVPTTFYWPGVTPPDGAVSDAVIQTTDFYPTILSLLGIPRPDGYPIDGIDFSAALRGEEWQRPGGMITYFPHTKTVPDWLPPSVSIIEGDWKLIRVFHYGENPEEHQYLLFNLKDDLGEKVNLAARDPERVRAMDAEIDEFLRAANVLTPRPNPDFDPARFDPTRIGVQPGGLMRSRTRDELVAAIQGTPADRPAATGAAAKGQVTTGGWRHGRETVDLRMQDAALLVEAKGQDPWIYHDLQPPLEGDAPYTLEFEILSHETGPIRVHGRTGTAQAFHPDEVHWHTMDTPGEWTRVSIPLTTKPPLTGLRISPTDAPGKTLLRNIRIKDNKGNIIQEWLTP
jgi:arylsulfatase A-like enzyme